MQAPSRKPRRKHRCMFRDAKVRWRVAPSLGLSAHNFVDKRPTQEYPKSHEVYFRVARPSSLSESAGVRMRRSKCHPEGVAPHGTTIVTGGRWAASAGRKNGGARRKARAGEAAREVGAAGRSFMSELEAPTP